MSESERVTAIERRRTCDVCGLVEQVQGAPDALVWIQLWRSFVVGRDENDTRLLLVHQRECAIKAVMLVVNRLYP